MELPDDVREEIARLLAVCKIYQVRALSLNHALTRMIQIPPSSRAALTKDQIQAWVSENRREAQKLANEIAAKLEAALVKDKDVLAWLKAYPEMVNNFLLTRFDH